MGVNNPEPAYFWDEATQGWRKALVGEPGEFVWNNTTNAWEFGTVGAEYLYNHTTKAWDFGPGGQYVRNLSTNAWDKVCSPGYGGSYYWDEASGGWVKNTASLAVSGLQALYDPSDLTSLYQSRTGGSTGAVDSVVGIMLDKSQMGGKTAAAFIAGQSELVTNGGFDADASWTKGANWAIGSGVATYTTGAANGLDQAQTIASGEWWIIAFDVTARTGSSNVQATFNGIETAGTVSAVGSYVAILRAAANRTAVQFYGAGGSGAISIDNVSIKKIPGYHALAPSDAARPILRSASGKNYLDADGTDDWMQIFPTLNLGEQWWHVGGWRADANDDWYFSTSATYRGGPRALLTRVDWTNSADVTTQIFAGSVTTPHIVTIEQASTTSLSGRYNGGGATTITPYDDTGSSQGLALFTSSNSGFSAGLDGRFYGGAFGTGSISSSDRSLLERYVAGLSGVTL